MTNFVLIFRLASDYFYGLKLLSIISLLFFCVLPIVKYHNKPFSLPPMHRIDFLVFGLLGVSLFSESSSTHPSRVDFIKAFGFFLVYISGRFNSAEEKNPQLFFLFAL